METDAEKNQKPWSFCVQKSGTAQSSLRATQQIFFILKMHHIYPDLSAQLSSHAPVLHFIPRLKRGAC